MGAGARSNVEGRGERVDGLRVEEAETLKSYIFLRRGYSRAQGILLRRKRKKRKNGRRKNGRRKGRHGGFTGLAMV